MTWGPPELNTIGPTGDRAGIPEGNPVHSIDRHSGPDELVARQRLLLVEDDFMLRQHLAELLAFEGYSVSSAADGAEALWRLEREPLPAAILLDLVLPRMNGVSFREAQLDSPVLRDIPTIVITATRAVRDLAPLGFAEIMSKPVAFGRLVEALAKVCASA